MGVKRLAELHNIDPVLSQRRTYRRTWVRLPGRDLQLDEGRYFLSHYINSSGCERLTAPQVDSTVLMNRFTDLSNTFTPSPFGRGMGRGCMNAFFPSP